MFKESLYRIVITESLDVFIKFRVLYFETGFLIKFNMAMFSLLSSRMICSREAKPASVVFAAILVAVAMNHESGHCVLIQVPSNKTAIVNISTYFNCSTSKRPFDERSISWLHYPLDAEGDRKYVYDDGRIMPNYKNRFDVEIDLSSGSLNLLALRLEPKDAGRYECRDGIQKGASAVLTVLEFDLACESDMDPGGVVGPTQCDRSIAPDEVQLSCRVTYNGRNAPQMVWRKAEGSSASTKTDCVAKDNRVTCNTTLTANLQLNGSVYICESTTQQYNCSLEIKNVLYVFSSNATVKIAMDEEVKCSANSSQSCSYKWKWFSGSDSLTVSTDQTLKPTKVGSHRCEATCPIGNTSCTVDATFVEVYSTEPTKGTNIQNQWLLFLWLLVILPIILIIAILHLRHRRASSRPTTSQAEPIKTEQSLPLIESSAENRNQVNQSHAETNEVGEMVLSVHSKTDASFLTTDQAEEEIVYQIHELLRGMTYRKSEHLLGAVLRLKKCGLIGARVGKSIVFVFRCENLAQLKLLQEMMATKELKRNIELIYNEVLSTSTNVDVEVTWDDAEVKKAESKLEEIESAHSVVKKEAEPKEIEGDVTPLAESEISIALQGLSLLEGRPEFVSTIKQEKDKENRITGVTVLKNELFVASENSPALEVYDVINKCAWKGRVPIPEMVNPFDLASCHITDCVFISDSKYEDKPNEIIRVESSMTVGKRWSTGDDFGNLSVSSDSNIILCVTDKNMLIEYAKDGENIRVINLSDIVHPSHAIKLTNGQFVVSHGCKNDTLHRVCNVNKDGEVVKSFGRETGMSLELLNEPSYLLVDEKGFVLVADSINRRVLLLDSDLKAKREFLTKLTAVLNPNKLCLCAATHNLYVVDSEYEVLIFTIQLSRFAYVHHVN